jgi:RNA polymerase sigma-70 factor, ECF subfamily
MSTVPGRSTTLPPPPRPAEDIDVPRAVAGDRSARRQVVQRHGPLVWSLCRRLDPHPEDAYQEAWEKVLRGLDRFDPDGRASLRTWIATVVHRHLVDRHRRRGTRADVIPLERAVATDPPADAELDRARRAARLERALARLPEVHRRVVTLHHLHGLALDDIAAGEAVAVGTIKSRLHRARARLAEMLGEDR